MIENLQYLLLGVFIVLVCAVLQPTRVRCPHGWWVNGVRPSGAFECRKTPRSIVTPSAAEVHEIDSDWMIAGDLYCGEQLPIVVDERTVGCQARH